MNTGEFSSKLKEAQNLMKQERYDKALQLLETLKEIEKEGDFDYSLTHKLYQLLSNSKSLFNQQRILNKINQISKSETSISLVDLNQRLKEQDDLNLELSILKREIELLILRSLVKCQIEGDSLILN
jgi:uncharacterized pyridoxamine 5'-phosphate oxidase family protein